MTPQQSIPTPGMNQDLLPVHPGEPYVAKLVHHELLRGIEDVHLIGDIAYLPCREGQRLTTVSIKDPTRPQILGTFTHPDLDQAAGFARDGDTVYLGSHLNHTLLSVDVSDPANMKFLGKVQIGPPDGPKGIYKMAYRDGYCYVALQEARRLYVVDLRDKTRPKVVSEVQVTPDDDRPFNVLLRGHYALVGTVFRETNRLAVVDIRNPLQPRLVTTLRHPAFSQICGQFVGDLLIAACWERDAVVVLNVADPAQPSVEGVLIDERITHPNRLTVVGDRAYMPMSTGHGVAVVDIAHPKQPRFVTSFVDPVILQKTYGITARGDLLFVGSREGNSLTIIDRHKLEK